MLEGLHEQNETHKCSIHCILHTIIHKINYIYKLFTSSIVIVPRHKYAHSIKKLEILNWPNTWNQLIEQSAIKMGWYHRQNCNDWRIILNYWSHPSAKYAEQPIIETYLTMFEQSQKTTSMCMLTPEIKSNIILSSETHTNLFPTMSVPSTVYDLTILLDMRNTTPYKKRFLCNWWYSSSRNLGTWYSKWTKRLSIRHNEHWWMWNNTWKCLDPISISTRTRFIWWKNNIF